MFGNFQVVQNTQPNIDVWSARTDEPLAVQRI